MLYISKLIKVVSSMYMDYLIYWSCMGTVCNSSLTFIKHPLSLLYKGYISSDKLWMMNILCLKRLCLSLPGRNTHQIYTCQSHYISLTILLYIMQRQYPVILHRLIIITHIASRTFIHFFFCNLTISITLTNLIFIHTIRTFLK